MSKEIKFNVRLNVDGKEQLVTAAMSAEELGRNLEEAKGKAGQMRDALLTFTQSVQNLQNLGNAVSQVTDLLNTLTAESRKFDDAMKAANTMAGKDAEGFGKLKDQVAELGKAIPLTRDQLANGLYQVISNGVPEDNWIEYLEKSAKASVGGIADVGEVVKVTSTLIKNYGKDWSDAGSIQDKIQLAAKNGVTSFEQLAQALPRVGGNAATLGVELDELLATFATLTGVSGNTSEVATQMAAVFTALVKPSSEAADMAEKMGITFNAASIKAAGGLQSFLEQLDKSVKTYARSSGMLEQEVYGKLFGSAESLRAIGPLTGNLAETFAKNTESMKNSAGTIEDAFGQMADTGEARLQRMKNAFSGVTDWIADGVSGMLPLLNAANQITMALVNVKSLVLAIKGLNVTLAVTKVRAKALSGAMLLCGLSGTRAAAGVRVLGAALKTGAYSATALKIALKGLMITTVVGVAVVALTSLLEHLVGKMGEASDKANELSEAEDAYKSAAANAKVEIDKETRSLADLIKAKKDTADAVGHLNDTYGDLFGRHKTAAEWYDVLTSKSRAYVKQIGYEAQAKVLATKLAEKQIELEGNFAKRRELWAKGKARKVTYNPLTKSYDTQQDSKEYADLKDSARGLIPEIQELQQQLDIVHVKMGELRGDMAVGVGGEALTIDKMDWQQVADAIAKTEQKLKLTTDTKEIAKLKAYNEQLHARKKALDRLTGLGTGGHATPKAAPQPTKAAPAAEGSMDWYEQRLAELRKQLRAAADEETARALQADYKATEQEYADLKVSIGVEAPDKAETDTALDKLRDELRAAQREFDDAVTVEAKVEASAKADDIQARIDEATRGQLTIGADVEPSYIAKGSAADLRQSYQNAQARATRIQQDYEIGLIDKDKALADIAEINLALEKLGDNGMKPIEIGVMAEDADKAGESLQDASAAIGSMGQALSGLGGAIEMPELNIAGTVAQAVATMALGYAKATSKAGKASPWEWVAFAATGLAQLTAMIASVRQATAFATGGIVGGGSPSGDRKFVRVNSGEMILNKTQQARLFGLVSGSLRCLPSAEARPTVAMGDISGIVEPAVTNVNVSLGLDARKMVRVIHETKTVAGKSGRKYS